MIPVSQYRLTDKKDIFLILILVATVFFCCIAGGEKSSGRYGEIYCDGELIGTVSLDENKDIPLKDGKVIIHTGNGGISFASSDCRDKLCVNCGVLTKNGQCAVCIPENTVIAVKGGKGVDTVSY